MILILREKYYHKIVDLLCIFTYKGRFPFLNDFHDQKFLSARLGG